MNGLNRALIQNQHGRYMHYRFLGQTDRIGSLFARRKDAEYHFYDENIHLTGWDDIDRYFTLLQTPTCFVLAHTPMIQGDDGPAAQATWMATGFFVQQDGTEKHVEQRVLRYDANFVLEDGQWKYRRLEVYYFMSLLPEPFHGAAWDLPQSHCGTLPPPPSSHTNAEDYVSIARLQGRWSHDRRKGIKALFSPQDTCRLSLPHLLPSPCHGFKNVSQGLDFLDTLESKNNGAYLSVSMTASPVIEIDHTGRSASACWLAMDIGMKGSAFGNPMKQCPVTTVLGRYDQRFIKENGQWKIEAFQFYPFMTLKPMVFSPEKSIHSVISFEEENWLYAPPSSGCQDTDAALEIEDYVGWWTAGLRYRSEAPFYYRFLARERPDLLRWTMTARQPGSSHLRISTTMEEIDNEIFGMTDLFQIHQPKGPGFHCATTPVVEIRQDGLFANAVWFDFGWTLQAEAFGRTEPPYPAEPAIARYEHQYVKLNGQWKLCQFKWFPLFRVEPWHFDYAQTKGWTGSNSPKRFPLPFTPYVYSSQRRDPKEPFELEPAIISSPREKQRGLTLGD